LQKTQKKKDKSIAKNTKKKDKSIAKNTKRKTKKEPLSSFSGNSSLSFFMRV
jgi:hypothetical protein